MKNLFKLFSVAVFSATLLFTGCVEDKCKKITCANDGTCADGLCICADGYEGDLCATESRAAFVGTYAAFNEVATVSGTDYTTNITGFKIENSSAAGNKVIITKFGNANETVVATVKGTTITIPTGTVINVTESGATVAWTVNSGTITSTTGGVKMDYSLTAGTTTASCKVTLATKQ